MVDRNAELVSVAICVYNGRPFVERALESVLAQTHDNLEVIVLDDGSTDGTADAIEAHGRDPRLSIVRHPHRGLGHARHAVTALATAPFVAFLDSDDEWLPGKLSRQLELMRAQPDAGLVFTDCQYIDAAGAPLGFASRHFGHGTIDFRSGIRALLTRGCFIDISSVLARREAVFAAGGFNPRLDYVHDYDLWMRIARRYPIEYVPEPLTRRRWHDAQFTRGDHAAVLSQESALLRPFLSDATVDADARTAIRNYLFGQHEARASALWRQQKISAALGAAAGAIRYPRPLLRHLASRAGSMFPLLRAAKRRWSNSDST
jgi:glycosyltransferase involved in cell wall biosynthesis